MNGGQDRRQGILCSRGWIHVSGVYTYRNKGNSRVCYVQCTGESNGMTLNLFSSVQSFSHVRLFATPWTAACQASLSITNSWSLLKLMSIKLVMPSNHLILCCPLLLLPSIFPSIKVFSKESVLPIRWPKCLTSFRMDWLDLLAVQGTLKSLLQQFKSISSLVLSFLYSPTLTSIHDYWKNHSFD